jgi:uncharacterized Zn finger protein
MWNYWQRYKPAKPREVKNGIKTKKGYGKIGETWWSERWISVLESFDMGARLTRGRSYARRGQVISIGVQKGKVMAKVQGTRPRPYEVEIGLKPISDRDWNKVTDAMASQAIFAAKLLSGEMPKNIEDAFTKARVSLFPKENRELHTNCSCPDWANPCKHIAAVYYLLAERFDEDPFLIFKLRGRTKAEIIQILREKRAMKLQEREDILHRIEPIQDSRSLPIEECLDTFWTTGKGLESFVAKPTLPEVEGAILKRLGKSPFSIGKKNLSSLLAKAYKMISRAALQKALMDNADIFDKERD